MAIITWYPWQSLLHFLFLLSVLNRYNYLIAKYYYL